MRTRASVAIHRSLGYVEVSGSLHVESAILLGHREDGAYVEILTDWVKRPLSAR